MGTGPGIKRFFVLIHACRNRPIPVYEESRTAEVPGCKSAKVRHYRGLALPRFPNSEMLSCRCAGPGNSGDCEVLTRARNGTDALTLVGRWTQSNEDAGEQRENEKTTKPESESKEDQKQIERGRSVDLENRKGSPAYIWLNRMIFSLCSSLSCPRN